MRLPTPSIHLFNGPVSHLLIQHRSRGERPPQHLLSAHLHLWPLLLTNTCFRPLSLQGFPLSDRAWLIPHLQRAGWPDEEGECGERQDSLFLAFKSDPPTLPKPKFAVQLRILSLWSLNLPKKPLPLCSLSI